MAIRYREKMGFEVFKLQRVLERPRASVYAYGKLTGDFKKSPWEVELRDQETGPFGFSDRLRGVEVLGRIEVPALKGIALAHAARAVDQEAVSSWLSDVCKPLGLAAINYQVIIPTPDQFVSSYALMSRQRIRDM